MNQTQQQTGSATIELIIFNVGDLVCGIDINHAQEINRNLEITPVPQSADYVRGVLNLRGQLITVIDLHEKLGLESVDINPDMRIIVVRSQDDTDTAVGLLVDGVDDIIIAREKELSPPPSNIGGVTGKFFHAVYKMETDLAAVLNIQEVLKKVELATT